MATVFAGCNDEGLQAPATVTADLAAMTDPMRQRIIDVEYESFVSSPPRCGPQVCAGGRGNPFWQWDVRGNGSLESLDLILDWSGKTQAIGDLALQVVCIDGNRPCPGGALAEAYGTPPLRVTAIGIEAPSGHAVEIQFWLGDDEWASSTASRPEIRVTGGLVFLLEPGARVVLDDESPRA